MSQAINTTEGTEQEVTPVVPPALELVLAALGLTESALGEVRSHDIWQDAYRHLLQALGALSAAAGSLGRRSGAKS